MSENTEINHDGSVAEHLALQLEKYHAIRNTAKESTDKIIGELEKLIRTDAADDGDLDDQLELLSRREVEIEVLDNQIRSLTDDIPELTRETAQARDYRDRITLVKNKVRRKRRRSASPVSRSGNGSVSGCNSRSCGGRRTRTKLPKLDLPKYDGDITKFNSFWSRFQAAVDEQDVSQVEKCSYLISCLEGEAKDAVDQYETTGEAYEEIKRTLKNRFGRKDLITHTHMNNLLELKEVHDVDDVKSLRALLEKCDTNIRSLKILGVNLASKDSCLGPTILRCLPADIRFEYSKTRENDSDWDIEGLIEFVRKQVQGREMAAIYGKPLRSSRSEGKSHHYKKRDKREGKSHHRSKNRISQHSLATASVLSTAVVTKPLFCVFCQKEGKHESSVCPQYSINEKWELLKQSKRCFICLRLGHGIRNCPSKWRSCKACQGAHNVALCRENRTKKEYIQTPQNDIYRWKRSTGNKSSTSQTKTAQEGNKGEKSMNVQSVYCDQKVLLKTAQVVLKNPYTVGDLGDIRTRCLFDDGSEGTFIHEGLSKALSLPVVKVIALKIKSFGDPLPKERQAKLVRLIVENVKDTSKTKEIMALEVPYLCDATTTPECDTLKSYMEDRGLSLADDCSHVDKSKEEIGLLIGSNYYWEMVSDTIHRITNSLVAIETTLGWVLQGPLPGHIPSVRNIKINRCEVVSHEIDKREEKTISANLRAFWELESLGVNAKENETPKKDEIMRAFEETIKFVGPRYQVKLPWVTDKNDLPNNLSQAKKRMKSLEQRFLRSPTFFRNYKQVIDEQLEQGIVEDVRTQVNHPGTYYMPNQGVVRDSSATTKLRVVLDGSSHAKEAPSLNACLASGPNLNPDLMLLLLRFRGHKVAIVADIEKAFLQVEIAPEDRDALRFLWVKTKGNEIMPFEHRILRMTRVPFGVTSSPFLLAATIKTHLKKYDGNRKEIQALNQDLYIDDLVTGSQNAADALELSRNAHLTMKEAGMHLRKWNTNSGSLRLDWEKTSRVNSGKKCPVIFNQCEETSTTKVLGLKWDPKVDVIGFDFSKLILSLESATMTKRVLLGAVAQIFDPLGLITPFTVRAKMLLQELWEMGNGWDEILPEKIREPFKAWSEELKAIKGVKIPRYYYGAVTGAVTKREIHCFCDSSMRAYAAVVYVRYETSQGRTGVSLVTSKTRVAPLKKLSLPRLELMACLLGARLSNTVKKIFGGDEVCVRLWTDSMVALQWVKGPARTWKPFISNRSAEIKELTDPTCWAHCPGKENPADLPTRGSTADELINNGLWWRGPDWLREKAECWPKKKCGEVHCSDVEKERLSTMVLRAAWSAKEPRLELHNLINLEKYSRLNRVIRITAWMLRFINNARESNRLKGPLETKELNSAEILWIKSTQFVDYKKEIVALRFDAKIPHSSTILSLKPTLDVQGILRIGGRLEKSSLTYEEKHPALLNRNQRLTALFVWRSHEQVFHGGVQATCAQLRARYWVPAGRQLVKSLIKKCFYCRRFHCKPVELDTAPLPQDRIEMSPPFLVVGVDYAGPLYIKTKKQPEKVYICLFTCAVTRAVHLELTGSLTTEEFMWAFRRMISRRGLPSTIYSDNARTFTKANADLKTMWEIMNSEEVKNFFGSKGISWKFIADRGAWWGGFWERMVRTTKTTLRKVLRRSLLSFQELATILVEVEAVINSRPITYEYSDANEPTPLTPSHLLIGRRVTSLPPQSTDGLTGTSTQKETIKRLRYRLALLDRLGRRWKNEYLLELRSAHHSKIKKQETNLNVGDVVIVHEEKVQRIAWKLAIVTEIQLGRDGKVRACKVRTAGGLEIRRPVQLLYNLEITT